MRRTIEAVHIWIETLQGGGERIIGGRAPLQHVDRKVAEAMEPLARKMVGKTGAIGLRTFQADRAS